MGLSTWTSRTRQAHSGFQKIASSTPRAADGVITGYVTRSTFSSGRVKHAFSPHTFTIKATAYCTSPRSLDSQGPGVTPPAARAHDRRRRQATRLLPTPRAWSRR